MSASKSPSRRRPSRPAKADNKRALVRAILRLPPDPRDVFLLHRMAGKSYEEIGRHLDMAPEAVRTNLAKAMALLANGAGAAASADNAAG
ncbi:sigma factor-like helix-turn-helix DNA-binding protein [Brevundimonas diminuta]|uniref:sigma-70 region 4 domain-containing protein n=1 Tax=Brevundimonas diminuta TaxID=293 RepID=UPI003D3504A5